MNYFRAKHMRRLSPLATPDIGPCAVVSVMDWGLLSGQRAYPEGDEFCKPPLAVARGLGFNPRMHEEIKLTREVAAIQIPSGDTLTLPAGTAVFITQRLGGTYTVATSQGLARISSQDADALGVNPEEEIKKQAEVSRLKDAPLEEQVWSQLKGVYDPEIPVDIVNLGLVYDCAIEESEGKKVVAVKMTLTAPGCGMGPVIAADAQAKIMTIDGIDDARVELVWDPAWNQEMISEEGRMKLGMV